LTDTRGQALSKVAEANPHPARVARAGGTYFAMVFGAGFVLGLIRVPFLAPRLGVRIAELLLTAALQGRGMAVYISGRDPVSGGVYLASVLVYAAMPWLQARRAGKSTRGGAS
jgi:hypothetical protein